MSAARTVFHHHAAGVMPEFFTIHSSRFRPKGGRTPQSASRTALPALRCPKNAAGFRESLRFWKLDLTAGGGGSCFPSGGSGRRPIGGPQAAGKQKMRKMFGETAHCTDSPNIFLVIWPGSAGRAQGPPLRYDQGFCALFSVLQHAPF